MALSNCSGKLDTYYMDVVMFLKGGARGSEVPKLFWVLSVLRVGGAHLFEMELRWHIRGLYDILKFVKTALKLSLGIV